MKFLKKLWGKLYPPIPEQDPNDNTKSRSSTYWRADDHYCKKCGASTDHHEYMASICNTCGNFGYQARYERSYRRIFYQGKWQYQVKYQSGYTEIREHWYNGTGQFKVI